MLSVKESSKQEAVQAPMSARVRYRLAVPHTPWLLKDGASAWKAMTVPVGRSLMMSQAQHKVLSTNGAGALLLPLAPCGCGAISSFFMSWVHDSSSAAM